MSASQHSDEVVHRRVETHCERGHRFSFFLPDEERIYRSVAYPHTCPICGWFYPMKDMSLPRRTTFSVQLDPFVHPIEKYRTDLRFYLTLRNSDGRWVRTFKPILAETTYRYLEQLVNLSYEDAVQLLVDEKVVTAKELRDSSWPRLAPPRLETERPDDANNPPENA